MSMSAYYPYLPVPFGFSYLRNRANVNPLVVNYHTVSNKELPHVIHLYRYRDVNGFKQDLDFFVSRYRPIGMLELLESLKDKRFKLPENAILLTFDDGFREIYDVAAPILLEKKLPATFFITSNCIDNKCISHNNKQSLLIDCLKKNTPNLLKSEIDDFIRKNEIPGNNLQEYIQNVPYKKSHLVDHIATLMGMDFSQFLEEHEPYLTTTQIEELLNNGFAIGGHSLDHARFTELTLEEQVKQAKLSVDYLVDHFSIGYRVFAFPYSDHHVSNGFFRALENDMDASFGTHGLKKDPVPNHYQRISVEKFNQSARRTIKFHYGRRIIYHLLGKEYMIRD